jgi:hypothetical protein
VPEEDMPKLLEIVHYLQTRMKKSKKSSKDTKVKTHFLTWALLPLKPESKTWQKITIITSMVFPSDW